MLRDIGATVAAILDALAGFVDPLARRRARRRHQARRWIASDGTMRSTPPTSPTSPLVAHAEHVERSDYVLPVPRRHRRLVGALTASTRSHVASTSTAPTSSPSSRRLHRLVGALTASV